MASVHTLLAITAVCKWDLFQVDMKNAFLIGDVTKEVYMKPHPGYCHSPSQVCKLCCALYGLKQAPLAWFVKFNSIIEKPGFGSSASDLVLFIWKTCCGITPSSVCGRYGDHWK